MMGTKKKTRKIPLARRSDMKQRSTTFTKRRQGLFSKSAELCTLFHGVQMAVIVQSINPRKPNDLYSFGHSSVHNVMQAFLDNTTPPAPVAAAAAVPVHQQQQQQQQRQQQQIESNSVHNVMQAFLDNTAAAAVPVHHHQQQIESNSDLDFEGIESIEEMEKVVENLKLLKEDVEKRIQQVSLSEINSNAVVDHWSDYETADLYQLLNTLDYDDSVTVPAGETMYIDNTTSELNSDAVDHWSDSETDLYQLLNNFDYDASVPTGDIMYIDNDNDNDTK
ncbi:hypothetical protein ACFE04_021353 [Oxalis oulophora]